MSDESQCPFCGLKSAQGAEELTMHIEKAHPENQPAPEAGPQAPTEPPSPPSRSGTKHDGSRHKSSGTQKRKGGHHSSGPESSSSSSGRRRTPTKSSASNQTTVVQVWRNIFSMNKSTKSSERRRVHHGRSKSEGRGPQPVKTTSNPVGGEPRAQEASKGKKGNFLSQLGKSELGRHHNENRMPDWLVHLLEKNQGVCKSGIVPILQQLLSQCPTTEYAYVCSPGVQHISKLRREGSFCGYRNIQMLTSYIIASEAEGANLFGSSFPSIFQIQDLIENAWDNGFNVQGRAETGGIRGTRKYIGTPEAEAMLSSLGIPCSAQAFKDKDHAAARNLLYKAIEAYFKQGVLEDAEKVHATLLPPIYFQRRGHSMTIVGFEKQTNGQSNLLVFDPAYRDSSTVANLVGKPFHHPASKASSTLEAYRRGNKYLRDYNEFEILWCDQPFNRLPLTSVVSVERLTVAPSLTKPPTQEEA